MPSFGTARAFPMMILLPIDMKLVTQGFHSPVYIKIVVHLDTRLTDPLSFNIILAFLYT
jgi:hypothetical protein